MKTKNITKNIAIIAFIIITSLSITSCGEDKTIDTKKTDSNTVKNVKKEEVKATNYEDLTKKENQSGRFEKIKKGETPTTIETKTWTDPIGDINISPNGWGSVKGWTDTGANPLEL